MYGTQVDLPPETPLEYGSQSQSMIMSQGSTDYRSERQTAKDVEKHVAKEGVKGDNTGEKEGQFSSPMGMSILQEIVNESLDLDSGIDVPRCDSYFRNCKPDAKYCFAELKITESYPSAVDSSPQTSRLKLLPIKAYITGMEDGITIKREEEEEEVTPRSLAGIKRENIKFMELMNHEPIKTEKLRSAKTESEQESRRTYASDFMC
jgi:hypothetical protein